MKLKSLLMEGKAQISQEFITMLRITIVSKKTERSLTDALNELLTHSEKIEGEGWIEQTRQMIDYSDNYSFGPDWEGYRERGTVKWSKSGFICKV